MKDSKSAFKNNKSFKTKYRENMHKVSHKIDFTAYFSPGPSASVGVKIKVGSDGAKGLILGLDFKVELLKIKDFD